MRYKLTFYMDGGHQIVIKCRSYEFSRLSLTMSNRELKIEKPNIKGWTIDLNKVQAFTAVRVLW